MPITISVNNSSYINKTQVQAASKATSTNEVSIFDEAKTVETKQTAQTNFAANDKNPEATFDRQTCKTLGISEKEWNAMSEEEKAEKNAIALKQIVDNHNNFYNTILGRRTTYANQYRIYAQRSSSPEEIARLTSVVASLDEKNQYKAIISEIEYKNPEFKNVADRVMANDYVGYINDNQVVAAQKIANEANEENKVLAAKNSTKADVKQQEGVVKALMSAKNEAVDNQIATQQGQYGIDEDGNKDVKVEANVFKAITNSKFVSALKEAAKNIFKLDSKNKEEAVNAIKATKVDEAIKEITVEAPSTTNNEKTANVNEEISIAIKNNDKAVIEDCIKSMTTTEVSQFISENMNNAEVIKKILASNPSQAVVNVINNTMVRTATKVDFNSLKNYLSSFGSEVQIQAVKQAKKSGNLGSIKRNFLSLSAQKEFDKIA